MILSYRFLYYYLFNFYVKCWGEIAIKKQRVSFYDNAKILLIFLVVLGHYIEPLIYVNDYTYAFFSFIYLFHMPAFIFVSGFFAKKEINKEEMLRLIVEYLLLFFAFQLIFVTFTKSIGIQYYKYATITPYSIYWYLFATFVWNLALKFILKIIEKLRIKIFYIIFLSFIVGLLVGFIDFISPVLSLSRIFVFFPFFIMGYYFKVSNIDVKKILPYKYIAILILLFGLFIAFRYSYIFSYMNVTCLFPYKEMGYGNAGFFYRAILYVAQIFMSLSFFCLVPSTKLKITSLGYRTLNIYVWHIFFIKSLIALHYFDNFSYLKITIAPIITLIIVYALSKITINLQLYKVIKLKR